MSKQIKNKKTVMLPLWMDRESSAYAALACDLAGIPKSAKKWKQTFAKAKNDYCLEAYTHSLTTPRMSNPGSSPRISKASFDLAPILFADNAKMLKTAGTAAEREELRRLLRSGIINLTQVFVKTVMGLKNKDFEYTAGMSTDAQRRVELNRYARLYVALQIVKALTVPMLMDKEFVNSEIERAGILPTYSVSVLRSKVTRDNFIKQVLGRVVDLSPEAIGAQSEMFPL